MKRQQENKNLGRVEFNIKGAMVKLIIAGSRNCPNKLELIDAALKDSPFDHISEVVWGGARGVDILAANWADYHSLPKRVFYAEWQKYGDPAGPIRNSEMIAYGDALLAIWDGVSRGTLDIIKKAKRAKLPYHIYLFRYKDFVDQPVLFWEEKKDGID